ncbi:MAG: hypothetical protein NT077_04615 [Candidatus Taylorbacteria bacterium]|nr:hypothetical protein [Candidatus Taylorbacteria bacterium]
MENTGNNNLPSFNDSINWKSLGFFSAEDYLIYIFKKTEKITAALYLVSGLLKDEEPMKWELRDRGMGLISSSFIASSSIPGDKNVVIQSIFSAALETISILNVAKVSHLISEMNHKLLVREIDNIVGLLRDRLTQNAESAGYVLSESFFKTPTLFSSGFRSDSRKENSQNSQISSTTKGKSDTVVKKSQRQEQIVNILRNQPNLTIKDFSKVIKDCSEKTIQRELLSLVQKGIIRKEGERRWSRYSLK